jgi:hypothetical protein
MATGVTYVHKVAGGETKKRASMHVEVVAATVPCDFS